MKVNSVNAPLIAKERGIKVKEVIERNIDEYAGLIRAKVVTDKGEWSMSGTIYGDKTARIVNINGLNVDVAPNAGKLLIINEDKPGMVGKVGAVLGDANINIGGMNVGRQKVGGNALTIVEVDNEVSVDTIEKISKISGIKKAKYVAL
jgi:D-3-phosphoglycerate dehydrogenase